MHKGYTVEDEYNQLKKLKEANMDYVALLMLGIAGKGNCIESAVETSKLLNKYKPVMIIEFAKMKMNCFPALMT